MSKLPTIGETRAQGIRTVLVTCARPNCLHSGHVSLDSLALPDDLPFIHIVRRKRFVCKRCGSRAVDIMPDWREYQAQGMGR